MRLAFTFLLAFALHTLLAQDKVTLQVKTFDQELKPIPNIEIAFNELNFFQVNAKGTTIIEVPSNELPIKGIRVKDRKLEAGSWNLSKGTIEIIIRPVKVKTLHVSAHFSDGTALANTQVAFRGATTVSRKSDQSGNFDLPIPIEDNVRVASQFEIDNVVVVDMSVYGDVVTLIVDNVEQQQQSPPPLQETTINTTIAKSSPATFDVVKLDSITSLAEFYTVFRNIAMHNLSENVRARVDEKFKQLAAQRQDSLRANQRPFIRNISDSSMVVEDIRNLLKQASTESGTLHKNREEFQSKIVVITTKLQRGVENLSEADKNSLRHDIDMLEQLLIDNESQFYQNHNDYREIINKLREKYLEVESLQNQLSETERLRIQENLKFRQSLFGIGSVVIVFGFLIILLVSFSTRLRRQARSLRNANDRIEQINSNLENIVARRTRLLEETNRELDTFLYRASHDLRSPVLSLTGLSQIIDHIDRQEMVQHVRLATNSMNRILNKLVDVSEISQEVANVKTVNVLSLINKVRNKHLVLSATSNTLRDGNPVIVRKRPVQFDVDCPDHLEMLTSPSLLEVIVDNLMENAIFYGGLKNSNEPVIVAVRANLNNDKLELAVRDNGVGIAVELRPRVFDMFFSGNVGSKGSGLGLYVVRKCVAALQGTIGFESEDGVFTEFQVTVPTIK